VSSTATPANAELLAAALLDHTRAAGLVDADQLRLDPEAALRSDPSVEVRWLNPSTLPAGCSIAAGYDRSRTPARLLIAKDASEGRRRFSLLHEYAHHLRDQVLEVVEALFAAHDAGAQLEEKICDEFAAQVLLPPAETATALAEGVTARGVLALIRSSAASAQACAVAAARQLPSPGYVMLLDRHGDATFTARAKDALPVGRDTPQGGLLARAATGGLALRDRAIVTFASGNVGPEMLCDTASDGWLTVAVLVTDTPAWGGLTVGRDARRGPDEQWCEHCAAAYTSYAAACLACGVRPCTECARCECERAVRGERLCSGCFQLLGPAAFPDSESSRCSSCE